MKTRISITLSQEILKIIDNLAGKPGDPCELIETVLRTYIAQMAYEERNARDLEIIDQHADRLNKEALDVLGYQRKR